MLKQKPLHYLLLFLSLLLYIIMGYELTRDETTPLFLSYLGLFSLYVLVISKRSSFKTQELNFWIFAALLFRVVLVFSIPALSDDFYRFIWDGRLLDAGYHPFAQVPSYYMNQVIPVPGLDAELYNSLNSKETFTIYPSFSQFIFWLSARLSPESVYGSVVVMKLVLFAFEAGTLWILMIVLRQFNQPSTNVLLYALNPLVILELTGNLHFEGVMVFFLMLSIFFLRREKPFQSSVAYALSICTKLIPLLFLPLLVRHRGLKNAARYWLLTGIITIALFFPLLSIEIINGFSTSLGYYFQRFEFNASIYYLIREVGLLIFGFNIIQIAGPVLALIATALILRLSFRNMHPIRSDQPDIGLFKQMVWCLLIYFLLTTILHPWYIVTLLAISILTPYRFPLVWTGLIFLTYAGYTQTGYHENLYLVALEYVGVTGYLLYETIWTKRQSHC